MRVFELKANFKMRIASAVALLFVMLLVVLATPSTHAQLFLKNGKVDLRLKWPGNSVAKYVLEISKKSKFPKADTEKFIVTGNSFKFVAKSAGTYFWRVRLEGKKQKRSIANIKSFAVVAPVRLPPPDNIRFAKEYTFSERDLLWSEVPSAEKYLFQIFDHTNQKLLRSEVVAHPYANDAILGRLSIDYAGLDKDSRHYFFARIAAINPDDEIGAFSKCVRTSIGFGNKGKSPPKASKIKFCNRRAPATIKQLSVELSTPTLGYNKAYRYSMLQVEGSSFLQGSILDQGDAGREFAAAMTTAIKGTYWLNKRFGFEGYFKSKVVGYNDIGNNISPTQLEARAMMRWTIPSFWPSFLREFQVAAVGGYEVFKNSVSGDAVFSPGYSLIKTGVKINIPVWNRWETGGDIIYGVSPDTTSKIELFGFLNYYYSPRWSIGTGYRIHLLKAGSEEVSADNILPYNEAYIELFGKIRYSF